MKETTKRILSLILAFVMVLGLLPGLSVNVSAAGDTHYLMFATDRHANTSVIGNIINNMESTIGENTLEYLALGGDMVGSGGSHPAYNSSTVLSEVTGATSSLDASNVDIVAGIHDMNVTDDAGIVLPYQGGGAQIYEGADYYVYGVEEYCISEDSDESNWSAEAQAFVDWANGETIDKSKVIFISSHYPLHAMRNDNDGAYYWHQALNAVATGDDETVERDIVFFHGHNHTENSNEYVYKVGDTMEIQSGSSTESDTIYYTYATAGYLNQNKKATLVTLTDEQIVLTKYGTSGNGTEMTTVKRAVTTDSGETTDPTEDTTPTTEATDPSEETTAPTEGTTEGNVTDYGTYNEVTLGGTTTTIKTKTVYLLSSGNPSGTVLIADANTAGDVHLVANDGGDLSNTTSTVIYGDCDNDGDSEYYIELTDATNELWTVSNSYRFANQDEYLRCSNGSLSVSSQSTTWSYSSNLLSYTSQNGGNRPGQGSSSTTYYLRYNSGWTVTSSSGSASSIYFYVPTEVEYEEPVSTEVTYTMRAEDLSVVVGENNKTADLDYCLQGNGADLTTLPTDGEYTFEVLTDENGIISSIGSDGTVNFTGAYGEATVEVAYTWTQDGETYTVYKNVTVTATEPTYVLDITSGGTVVTGTTIAKKGVTDGMTLQLGTQIQFVDEEGAEIIVLPDGATIEWHIPEEYQNIAEVDHETGLVTFKGVDGAFYVTATLTVGDKNYTVGVNISATTSQYSTPTDGTGDFPEYPNEGAIRYDKTGTAVGNFSETGIAQIELSMTGVPYTTGSEIDVVVMLDMSTSMDDDRIAATVAATKVFVESIVKNTDGSYNSNRIYVGYFNGDTVYTITGTDNIGGELATVDNDTEYDALIAAIEDEYDGALTASGTNYDVSLEECYNVLTAAKKDGIGNDRDQFVLFMSDGGPTDYATSASNVVSESTVVGWFDVSASDSANWTNSVVEEYWSGLMKDNGVTIYSVGLILQEKPTSGPSDYRSYSADQNYYVTSTLLTGIASGADYFINCESATDTADMEDVFSNIAAKILQAATDITVEDQITDEYTMIFDIPEGSKDITGVTNDFYIEFGKYALDEDHERTTFTSVTKLYLQNTDGKLSAKDTTDPVFEAKTIGDKGTLYYWSTNADDGDTDVSITVDETTYYFVSYGLEEAGYNMTSGTYARGTVDSTTNMSEDLVIATPYFVYNADTRMLYWTVDKLDTYEYALRYFLYLNNSATEVATSKETDPGPYPTNDHAYITYTNFKGNDCRQVFPIPQLTWNGAQVSYVFYLVNAQGQPINKSGQVVDFANATFITDVYTEAVVWNKAGDTTTGTGELSADWLAVSKLPDEYDIYDEQARYVLNVYENADGSTIKNQFTISGNTADEISKSLNTRLELETTASTVSISTTKVYNTKAGEKISAYGTYTSADDNMKGFDFANTTVAFAVVWQPRLAPDVVVVDYGLDVLINVVQNDILQNKVTGIGTGTAAYEKENVGMNTGVSTTSKLGTAALTIDGNTISIENETSVRFHQGDTEFNKAVEFYYETPVEFWEGSDPTEGFMYSSVTVIPATTIYYEDEFVDLSIWDMNDVELNEEWAVVGTTVNDTQDQDRPGDSKISDAIDADNIYGYDSAYTDCAMYSMGSARVVTVDDTRYAEAKFTFYGTGFDIISLTSNTSGTISVDVYGADDFAANEYGAAVVKSGVVDTYYGYTQDEDGNWIVDTDVEGKLYQIPVMKISDLEYGKYTVIITTAYYSKFDHQNHGSLDFYLDAVRIYDPTGNADSSINDYYVEDHEGWPVYQELRNNVIESADDAGQIAGAVYIDGAADNVYAVADYNAYGPNNELYLAPGQMIAFSMNLDTLTKLDKLHIAMKSANGGTVSCQIFDAASIQDQGDVEALKAQTIATATDLYYDISDLKDDTIVIYNSSTNGAILSITNLKATFTEDPGDVTINFSVIEEDALTALLTALNTAETEGEETTDPTDPSEPSEGTEDEDTGSGSSSTIGRIIDWLRKLLGWG